MKILCEYTPGGPHFVRWGWKRVFEYCGHSFTFWNPQTKPAFDAFAEVEPDVAILTTYGVDAAVEKCLLSRPDLRVAMFASAWGPHLKDIDLKKYPLVVASEGEKRTIERLKKATGQPSFVFIHVTDKYLESTMGGWRDIGVEPVGILNAADTFVYYPGTFRPELACDATLTGSYWPYKARKLVPYIFPLCERSSGLNVKLFGYGQWPVPNYLGRLSEDDERDLYASATICLNVSESHSTDLGFDTIERPFKLLACGAFCVSDHVDEAATEIFASDELVFARTPEEFHEKVHYFAKRPDERRPYMERGRKTVLEGHTYFHRVAKMFKSFRMPEEEKKCLAAAAKLLPA